MTSDSRAFVALVSARLARKGEETAIQDENNEQIFTFGADEGSVAPTAAERSCPVCRDVNGDNYCLRDRQLGAHICLSLYGRLFEGFDHGSASHFNGIIDGPQVTLYDFSASDFFSYQIEG